MGILITKDTRRISFVNTIEINPALLVEKSIEDQDTFVQNNLESVSLVISSNFIFLKKTSITYEIVTFQGSLFDGTVLTVVVTLFSLKKLIIKNLIVSEFFTISPRNIFLLFSCLSHIETRHLKFTILNCSFLKYQSNNLLSNYSF